jgi:DNA polymerase
MLASIGLSREKNCYIVNIVKCRPPHNRDPEEDEIRACTGYLERQIRLLKPKLILCAGRVSARYILKSEEGLERLREKIKLRGGFGEYTVSNSSSDFSEEEDDETNRGSTEMFHSADELNAHYLPIPVLATYHPSALLHDESLKRPVFEDMKLLMTRLVDLDRNYAGDVKELLRKYAATDDDFANRVQEYLA